MKSKNYVIGVDGGGTKTITALTDLEGKILKMAKSGPSNLRNSGIKRAVLNIGKGILKVTENFEGQIVSCFIALAAVEEEYRERKEEIKKALFKIPGISKILKGKLIIGSDQLAALKTGTDEKDGVILIAGTGAVCHGWWKGKEAKVSGWGWLNDEGSGFWVGQKAFQVIFKALDGRSKKTLIKEEVFKQFDVKNKEELMAKVYGFTDSPEDNFVKNVSLMSIAVDKAAKKDDKVAKEIFTEAAKELANSATRVIEKLGIEREKFPLIFVGKIFESNIVFKEVKKAIKKVAPNVKFISPQGKPVIGAVKLAIEQILGD